MGVILRPKQQELNRLIAQYQNVLAEGGARSGKTFDLLMAWLVRALKYPAIDQIVLRYRAAHIRKSIWDQTLPKLLRLMGLGPDKIKLNDSDMALMIRKNRSRILFDGLDDKERVEKILGQEYAGIYFNESSQISWETVETVTTRLNWQGVPLKIVYDYNPPSIVHWGYKIFHKRVFPDGRPVPDNDYKFIRINPIDNLCNLSSTFYDTLSKLSGAKRKRFLEGEYGLEEGSLWNRSDITYGGTGVEFIRVVVAVDPSGSTAGDEIGIVVVALGRDGRFYVLDDYSLHGSPKEWGDEVRVAYERYKADCVVAEKNYGGDMVEAVITNFNTNAIAYKAVDATRGKVVRAEPCAMLYKQGRVSHFRQLLELEDELCTWKPDLDKSPNRLDALVWGLTELAVVGGGDDSVEGLNELAQQLGVFNQNL
jgi:hypothetical protein